MMLAVAAAGGYRWLRSLQPVQAAGRAGVVVTAEHERELDRRIERFCAECHAFPPPGSFPKVLWEQEVRQAFALARERDPELKDAPSFDEALRYFERRAPEGFPAPDSNTIDPNSSARFKATGYPLAGHRPLPGVSNVAAARLSPPHERVVTVCDMRNGFVLLLDLAGSRRDFIKIADLPHPARAEPVDLDGDGLMDLIVADLGSLMPGDHRKGQVVWLRRNPDSATYEPVVIARGLPRVADVRPADFDGDGDLDLIVAAFGWRNEGEILYLENKTTDWSGPRFEASILLKKAGAIHVPIVDLNEDGHPDFVALVSQEHEQIIAFLNDGSGGFRQEILFAALDPAYGSTGIQLVDFDQDGDLDVLYTNGDSLDSHLIKPYHGVQWLENEGHFPFRPHFLAAMPGVHRAIATDLDGDGDLDVVACAFLPNAHFSSSANLQLDSLMWLENRGEQFVRRSLELRHWDHASLDVADVDEDGHPDILVGNFTIDGIPGPIVLPPMPDWITIWQNHGSPPRAD